MKKVFALVLALALMMSCAAFAETSKVTLWATGSQNMYDMFNAVAAAYNASQDTYEVEVQFILSGTGDEGLEDRICAAYLAGQTDTDFDVIAVGTDAVQNYVDQCGTTDILIDLDKSKITGIENVLSEVPQYAEKIVPYRATMVVFAYDSERIPEDEVPTTWDELTAWIEAHPGRFAYNEPDSGGAGKSFVITSVYRHMPAEAWVSSDESWTEQYSTGIEWLKEIHPYLYSSGGNVLYPNKNQGTLDLLINQEVDMIPAWADQTITNVANGTLPATTRMMQLSDQPLTGNLDCLAIPSIGSNQEGAYDFISYCISPEAQKIALEVMAAVPVIDTDSIDSDQKDLVAGLNGYANISIGSLWADHLYQTWMEEILTM